MQISAHVSRQEDMEFVVFRHLWQLGELFFGGPFRGTPWWATSSSGFSIRSAPRGRRCDPDVAGMSQVGESPNATTRPIGWVRGNPPQFSLVCNVHVALLSVISVVWLCYRIINSESVCRTSTITCLEFCICACMVPHKRRWRIAVICSISFCRGEILLDQFGGQ